MFCFQCQETAKGTGCTIKGVCGKTPEVAGIQDVLMYFLRGLSVYAELGREKGIENEKVNQFVFEGLFMTITNANFDHQRFVDKLREGFELRKNFILELEAAGVEINQDQLPEAAKWVAYTPTEFERKAQQVGVLQMSENEDVRSLRELTIYGIKGMAAYAEHAYNLGFTEKEIFQFMQKGLASTLNNKLTAAELTALVLETGKYGVQVMALLDKATPASMAILRSQK